MFLSGTGFGWEAISSNLAERRSWRADSVGPKTLALSRKLFAFFVLAREDLAILKSFVVRELSGMS